MTTRRKVVLAVGLSALAAPLACFAQARQQRVPRIGLLEADTLSAVRREALIAGLREHGLIEGRNVGLELRDAEELDAAYASMARDRISAVIILASLPRRAVDLALKHQIAPFTSNAGLADGACVMTYSADLADLGRKAARQVDRIFKGAKPADLPIQQPTKFQLLINLKSARALGLTVPQSVLLRADKVIE